MHHEIIFFLFFQVFFNFLVLGLPYFFFITWVRSISILLKLVVRRTLSTYKLNLVRLRTVSFCSGIVVKNRARKSPAKWSACRPTAGQRLCQISFFFPQRIIRYIFFSIFSLILFLSKLNTLFFLYKNLFYKNIDSEAGIGQNFLRTYPD